MREHFKVYLSGPINGLTYDESIAWTDKAALALAGVNIMGYKPLRGKKFLKDKGKLEGTLETGEHFMASNKSILMRDTYDVRSCDAILVNLLGAQKPSFGTVSEIAMGYAWNKPIVLVMEKEGNIHHHCFVLEMASFWVHDLETGIDAIKSILLPWG